MGQPRVPIHYFEKKAKPKPKGDRHTQELRIPPGLSRAATLGDMEPPIASNPRADAPPAKGKRRRKRPTSLDELTPVTDPQITVPTRMDAWVQQGGSLGGMSRQQVAQMCLFGHHLFENRRLPEAKVVFESIVSLGVTDAFPHTMLGTIHLAQGDAAKALPLFEAALKLDARDVAARVYRGEIRLRSGQTRAGLGDLRKAAGLAPASDPFVARAKKLIERATSKSKARR